MKSAKEFFERLKSDEAFAKEFSEAVQAKREAGATNYYETFLPAAEEKGYLVTKEDLDEVLEEKSAEISEEDLGKVAGGTSCLPVTYGVALGTVMLTGLITVSISMETTKD